MGGKKESEISPKKLKDIPTRPGKDSLCRRRSPPWSIFINGDGKEGEKNDYEKTPATSDSETNLKKYPNAAL